MTTNPIRAAAAALLIAATGCAISTPDLDGEGVIRFFDIEGGCWGIESGGQIYEPIDLPEAMRVDGLVVVFTAEILEDRLSICQIGPVVDLLRITTPRD
jgi:hypothetical protein